MRTTAFCHTQTTGRCIRLCTKRLLRFNAAQDNKPYLPLFTCSVYSFLRFQKVKTSSSTEHLNECRLLLWVKTYPPPPPVCLDNISFSELSIFCSSCIHANGIVIANLGALQSLQKFHKKNWIEITPCIHTSIQTLFLETHHWHRQNTQIKTTTTL